MNNQELDKQTEDLLTELGKELGNSRTEYSNAILDSSQPDPPFYTQNMKKPRARKMVRRGLLLVAVLVLMLCTFVVSSTGVGKKMFNQFFDTQTGHTNVQPLPDSDKGNLPNFKLNYVPKGYKFVSKDKLVTSYSITYQKADKKYITMSVSKTEDYTSSIDNDTLKRKEILVNDYQAYLFYDDSTSAIIWQVGDYTLDLFTEVSVKEAEKIADNIQLVK